MLLPKLIRMSIVQFLKTEAHLQERLASFQESFSKNIQALSFTGFVLKQKAFSEEDYFSWAQRTYQMPWLKNDFFHLHNPESQVWEQWKDFYSWRPDCIPLAHWDGVLFVGCLEKPTDWPANNSVCFVLSTLSCLESWYSRYTSGNVVSSPVIQTPDPQISPTSAEPVKPKEAVESLELVDEVSPEEGSEKPNEEIEVLEGFEGLTKSGPAPDSDIFSDMATPPAPPSLSKTSSVSVVLTQTAPAVTSVTQQNTISEPKTGLTKTGIKSVTPPPVANIPVPPATPKRASPVSTATIQGNHPFNKYTVSNPALVSQIKVICEPLKTLFNKYIILSVSDSRTETSPVLWSDSVTTEQKPSQYKTNINAPCVFSIVANTYKPFHGYITPNDINEKFFEDWNQGEVPEHATIVPIVVKDQLIAMVMALGEKSAFNPQSLRFVEKIAKEVYQKMTNSAAKAA